MKKIINKTMASVMGFEYFRGHLALTLQKQSAAF